MSDGEDYLSTVQSLAPELVDRLRTAVQTGRWPDGRELSAAQRENSLQAIIAWERAHLPEEQRTGYVAPKPEVDRADRSRYSADIADEPGNLRWVGDNDADGGESQ